MIQTATSNRTMKSSFKSLTTVLTKKYDGGSSEAKRKILRSSDRHMDPFSYYSSQDIRMNALLRNQDIGLISNNGATQLQVRRSKETTQAQYNRPEKRQTRLTFELHPNLFIMEMLGATIRDEELDTV